MLWRKSPEVIVVGAGPVGLVTALSLAKRGVRVEIIDEAWAEGSQAYALALHPRSLTLLDELDVLEPVLEMAYRVDQIGLYGEGERRAALSLSTLDCKHPFVAVLRQDRLEALLMKKLASHHVKVQWSHRLRTLEPHADHVEIEIDRLGKESLGYAIAHTEWVIESSKKHKVPFVIGCDGHHSLVRRRMEADFPEVAPAQHFAVFECKTDFDFGGELRLMLNASNANVVWPMPGKHCRFSFELPDYGGPPDGRFKSRIMVEMGADRYPVLEEDRMQALLAERAPWFDGQIEDVYWRLVVRFERRIASSFGSGRVWLAGDAGHMASPVGIQSMNVGLREGCTLADTIADVLKGDADASALSAYGAARQTEWQALQGLDGRDLSRGHIDPWLTQHAAEIRGGLPVSGPELDTLMRKLGFAS